MAKQMKFTYDGEEYILEFTKRTVKEVENAGFNDDLIGEKPMTMIPLLFKGAFLAHHRREKDAKINEIFNHLTNKEQLILKLVEMYNDPINSILDEPDVNDEKKVDWRVDF